MLRSSSPLGALRRLPFAAVLCCGPLVSGCYTYRLVEEAPRDSIFSDPKHPYTQMLFAAAPKLDAFGREVEPPKGEIPDPINPPSGCAYHPRCPFAIARCTLERPEMRPVGGSRVACHVAK